MLTINPGMKQNKAGFPMEAFPWTGESETKEDERRQWLILIGTQRYDNIFKRPKKLRSTLPWLISVKPPGAWSSTSPRPMPCSSSPTPRPCSTARRGPRTSTPSAASLTRSSQNASKMFQGWTITLLDVQGRPNGGGSCHVDFKVTKLCSWNLVLLDTNSFCKEIWIIHFLRTRKWSAWRKTTSSPPLPWPSQWFDICLCH